MKKKLFLFVAALCFGSWATAGDLTFEKVGDFAWVNQGAIVAIDINGDGYQSVLYMERADDKRSVYLANNKGTLTKYEYGKEEGLKDLGIAFHENPGMVVMDVNKDGKQDVVVAGGWPPAVNVYLNNGAGAFTKDEKQTNLIGARDYDNSDYLAAGDYDNDGWEDLFVLGLTTEAQELKLSIYRNNNGVFELANQALEGCRGGSIAVGDVNGDNNLDVFYNGYGSSDYVTNLYYGDGKGTWTKAEGIEFEKSNKGDVAIIDFNGDGKMDLIEQSRERQTTSIYCNNGDGTFTKKTNEETSLPKRDDLYISYGDFNADGKMDIIASHWQIGSNGEGVALYINNGDFTFTKVDLAIESRGSGVFAWDYDNDKKCDYIVWAYSDSKGWFAPIVRNTTVIEEPKPETYTVTIVTLPEGAGVVTGAGEYEDGAEVTVTAEESDEYIFWGWLDATTEDFVAYDPEYTFQVLDDVTLIAYYLPYLEGMATDLVIGENTLTASAELSIGKLYMNLVLGEEEDGMYWLAETSTLSIDGNEATLVDGMAAVNPETQMAGAEMLVMYNEALYYIGVLMVAPETGVDNIQVENVAVKMIKNGQLIINQNGREFNVQGAQL